MLRFCDSSTQGLVLSPLLQKGVWVAFAEGESVAEFIRRCLGLNAAQVEKEVQTLILNNGCVDDPEGRLVEAGDVLVLSGAMPGLVGAMLRSNSPIKAMRAGMSSDQKNREAIPLDGAYLKLKLFNTVLRDHQRDILNIGFYTEDDND